MEAKVRDTLQQLIRRFGYSLAEEPARCEAMLKDLCGAHKREINVLMGALRQRVAVDLLAAGQVPAPMLLGRLTQRLEDDLAMAAEPAFWAVETWALALEVIDRPLPVAPTAPPRSTRPAPPAARPRAPTPTPSPPSGVPNIHGWPADRVQALQRDAARSLGLAVVFRDPGAWRIKATERVKTGERKRWLSAPEPIYEEREVVKTVAPPELVVIPSGSFIMGSPEDEEERADEGPQHRVTIARPFALGRHAVTFDDYDAFCNATGRAKPGDQGWGRGRQPVVNVTWDDAVAYCKWLSGQTGQDYRLPSEAEWEYACRAGTATPFHFGATLSTAQANYNGEYSYGPGVEGQYRQRTVEVGSLPANPWGLHEVHGNVWEWCDDCWNESNADPPTDGSAWRHGNCAWHLVRGGSWFDSPWFARSAIRCWVDTGDRFDYLGFRLARTLSS